MDVSKDIGGGVGFVSRPGRGLLKGGLHIRLGGREVGGR